MKSSDDLFQLIHSMTHGEKWRFKAYSGRHFDQSRKNFLKLFEAIEQQVVYDEDAIKKQFIREKFVRQFSVAKNYLYRQIMQSLETYHVDTSANWKVMHLVYQAEILYHRGLFNQAKKLGKRAMEIARRHELQLPQMGLLFMEQQLMIKTQPQAKHEAGFQEIFEQEDVTFAEFQSTQSYLRLMRKALLYVNVYGFPRNDKDMERYKKLFAHPLLKSDRKALTVKAKAHYYSIKSYEHMIANQMGNAYHSYKNIIRLIETRPECMATFPADLTLVWAGHLFNFLTLAINAGQLDTYYERLMRKYKRLFEEGSTSSSMTMKLRAQIFINYHCLRLLQYVAQADFEEGFSILPLIQKGLQQYKKYLNTLLSAELYINLGQLYFYAGRFDDALYWFNKALNHPVMVKRESEYGWLKILALITQFELGNVEVLEHSIRSIYRYLGRGPKLYQCERLMLRFFRSEILSVMYSETEQIKAFKKLHKELMQLQRSPYEAIVLQRFDLLSWLESHIQKRPLPEIVKEKVLK